jgi:hypothetical protein
MSSTVANRFVLIATAALALCINGSYAARPATEAKVVATLYQDYAWQAITTQSDLFGEGLASASESRLSRYFSPELAKLLVADSACQAKAREICNLDFDILFDSQDPRVADLDLQRVAPGRVHVRFTDPVTDKKTHIDFRLATVNGDWRITDIVYQKHPQQSLKNVLSRPIPSH